MNDFEQYLNDKIRTDFPDAEILSDVLAGEQISFQNADYFFCTVRKTKPNNRKNLHTTPLEEVRDCMGDNPYVIGIYSMMLVRPADSPHPPSDKFSYLQAYIRCN